MLLKHLIKTSYKQYDIADYSKLVYSTKPSVNRRTYFSNWCIEILFSENLFKYKR